MGKSRLAVPDLDGRDGFGGWCVFYGDGVNAPISIFASVEHSIAVQPPCR